MHSHTELVKKCTANSVSSKSQHFPVDYRHRLNKSRSVDQFFENISTEQNLNTKLNMNKIAKTEIALDSSRYVHNALIVG